MSQNKYQMVDEIDIVETVLTFGLKMITGECKSEGPVQVN